MRTTLLPIPRRALLSLPAAALMPRLAERHRRRRGNRLHRCRRGAVGSQAAQQTQPRQHVGIRERERRQGGRGGDGHISRRRPRSISHHHFLVFQRYILAESAMVAAMTSMATPIPAAGSTTSRTKVAAWDGWLGSSRSLHLLTSLHPRPGLLLLWRRSFTLPQLSLLRFNERITRIVLTDFYYVSATGKKETNETARPK